MTQPQAGYLPANIPGNALPSDSPEKPPSDVLLLGQVTVLSLSMAVKFTWVINPRWVHYLAFSIESTFSLKSQEIRQQGVIASEELFQFRYRTELLKAATFKNVFDGVYCQLAHR